MDQGDRCRWASLDGLGRQARLQLPIIFLRDPNVDKDRMARELAAKPRIESGLVCALSVMEPSPTFEYVKSKIAVRLRPCHMFYQYQKHPQLGWMYARVQSWFPFNMQVGSRDLEILLTRCLLCQRRDGSLRSRRRTPRRYTIPAVCAAARASAICPA